MTDEASAKKTEAQGAPWAPEAAAPGANASGAAGAASATAETESAARAQAAAAEREGRDPVLSRLGPWFDKVAADWSAALGKKVTASAGEAAKPDAAGLAAALAASPLAVEAKVKTAAATVPVVLLASEQAAITVAREALGEAAGTVLNDTVTSAFGELARQVYGSLEVAWRADHGKDLQVDAGHPSRPEKLADDFSPGSRVVAINMKAESGAEVSMSFVLPPQLDALFAVKEAVEQKPSDAAMPQTAKLERILKINVPLVVEIARRRIKVREVLSFKPGTVLEFDKRSDDLLDLLVGKAAVGKGEAIKVGEGFGLRVLDIGPVRDRIKLLGR